MKPKNGGTSPNIIESSQVKWNKNIIEDIIEIDCPMLNKALVSGELITTFGWRQWTESSSKAQAIKILKFKEW